VEPEILETQMRTQVLQRAMQAKREQMEAQEQLRKMEEEMMANVNGDKPSDGE
jgi:hypothetical protein